LDQPQQPAAQGASGVTARMRAPLVPRQRACDIQYWNYFGRRLAADIGKPAGGWQSAAGQGERGRGDDIDKSDAKNGVEAWL